MFGRLTALTLAGFLMSSVAWAGPKVVSGPGARSAVLQALVRQDEVLPVGEETRTLQDRAGQRLRRQHLAHPDGQDRQGLCRAAGDQGTHQGVQGRLDRHRRAAQLGAIEDFINQGYDAIVTIAVSPEGFDRIIRLADKNNVIIVPFDNILDTDKVMMVNEDQKEMGRMSAKFLLKEMGKKSGDILEVRGLPGNSVDRDRHVGFREVMEGAGNNFKITEVVGNWDTGTSQKVTADALAVHGHFDGIFSQGGDDGTVQALIDAKLRSCRWRARARTSSASRSPTTPRTGSRACLTDSRRRWSPSPSRRRSRRCKAMSCRN